MTRGPLPLLNIVECGYLEETGFVWVKQKKKVEHYFDKVGRMVSYAAKITAYIEEFCIRRVQVLIEKLHVGLERQQIFRRDAFSLATTRFDSRSRRRSHGARVPWLYAMVLALALVAAGVRRGGWQRGRGLEGEGGWGPEVGGGDNHGATGIARGYEIGDDGTTAYATEITRFRSGGTLLWSSSKLVAPMVEGKKGDEIVRPREGVKGKPLGVNPWPLRWCQRPDLDADTNPGVQRYGRQSLWPACAAELQASETRQANHWGLSPTALKAVKSAWVPGRPDHAWRPSALSLTLSQRPETAAKFLWTEQFTAVKPCEISNLKHVKRLCVVGDVAPLEEVAETDSERGD
ncbi:hypothetical protein Taro_010593 [Colocasia esculenta]|uniref:Uncharacterized protein n=1 Tax=Colocasia esculenta TaxID=4460 RepID=A0A843TZC9_COLES|nr:hypothetical protein [Colocasia esculenta]